MSHNMRIMFRIFMFGALCFGFGVNVTMLKVIHSINEITKEEHGFGLFNYVCFFFTVVAIVLLFHEFYSKLKKMPD